MKLYVGVTDDDWFTFLASAPREEVNFWSPSGNVNFHALLPGEPFLFKLHSPRNFIVGGGFFISHSKLPVSLAWDAFQENNGAADFSTCLQRVRKYRKTDERDPVIGCNILATPFFFAPNEWIPAPLSFKLNTVQGKGYNTEEPDGKLLWQEVQDRLSLRPEWRAEALLPAKVAEGGPRYGTPTLVRPRLGQGAFRVLVTEAYDKRCALTGERTLPVLDAAHIRPYADHGPHDTKNGLLMRSDLHTLFDHGYLTVRPDFTIDVSRWLHEEYQNGRIYYALQGKPLAVLPSQRSDQPSEEYLSWHNQNIFRP